MRLHSQEPAISFSPMPMNSFSPEYPPMHETDADEREFEIFAQAQDPLDIKAATWVVRKQNGLTPESEAELQTWLDADPRHAAAFEDMDATFGDVQQLPDGDVASLKASLPERTQGVTTSLQPAVPPPARRPAAPRPNQWLGLGQLLPHAAAAVIVCAVVCSGWMGWDRWRQLPTFDQTYATERGQQLTVRLPDATAAPGQQGSTLQLDTATQVNALLYRDRREIHLKDGQALLAVHSDAQRPFHVWAGPLRITVLGTRFSVRHTASGLDAGQTVVSVEEGRVRVARLASEREGVAPDASLNDYPFDLTAGQRVVADDSGHIGPVATVSLTAIASWRNGRISFDQTPLAQAVAEFERYGRTGLVVRDPAVAALPVGGSYSLRQFQHFVETLPQVLPVRLVRRGEVTEVMAH